MAFLVSHFLWYFGPFEMWNLDEIHLFFPAFIESVHLVLFWANPWWVHDKPDYHEGWCSGKPHQTEEGSFRWRRPWHFTLKSPTNPGYKGPSNKCPRHPEWRGHYGIPPRNCRPQRDFWLNEDPGVIRTQEIHRNGHRHRNRHCCLPCLDIVKETAHKKEISADHFCDPRRSIACERTQLWKENMLQLRTANVKIRNT